QLPAGDGGGTRPGYDRRLGLRRGALRRRNSLRTGLLRRGLLRRLLGDGSLPRRAKLRVVGARLVLPLLLGAGRDGGSQMLRGEPECVDEVERVRAQPRQQPVVDVVGDRRRASGRETAVDEVPGEVLLDEGEPEE